jgi:N-hydroxyarylamine O-acetyltransferase
MGIAQYFERIDYRGRLAPTLDVLSALIAHQAASIPFEAIDVLLKKGVDIGPEAIFDKLVRRKRGGYCFEQNGLLCQVLKALGFSVETLIARVLWMRPADAPPAPPTHMVLRVRIDGRDYLADAGFGNGTPTAPLAFDDANPQRTPLDTFRLVRSVEGHRLEMQIGADWAPAYDVFSAPRRHDDFADANVITSTSPQSPFTQALIMARATRDARYLLNGNMLTIRAAAGSAERSWFNTADELRRTVETVFCLSAQPDWQPIFELFTSPKAQIR